MDLHEVLYEAFAEIRVTFSGSCGRKSSELTGALLQIIRAKQIFTRWAGAHANAGCVLSQDESSIRQKGVQNSRKAALCNSLGWVLTGLVMFCMFENYWYRILLDSWETSVTQWPCSSACVAQRIERMKGSLHFLGVAQPLKHTIFVDEQQEAAELDPATFFDTPAELLGRNFNRPRTADLAQPTLLPLAADNTSTLDKTARRVARLRSSRNPPKSVWFI